MYVSRDGKATVTRDRPTAGWLRHIPRATTAGPSIWLLVDALETAVREGELQPGDQLPPQRTVADHLGIDFTTVTRAYGAARERGLVEGAVGRGTFVRRRAVDDEAGLVDLSMNLPPPPQGVSLAALLKETTAAILDRTDVATLMAYHAGPARRARGPPARPGWRPTLGEIGPDRVVVCPGAQSALTAILTTIATTRRPHRRRAPHLSRPDRSGRAPGLAAARLPGRRRRFPARGLARLCAEKGRPPSTWFRPRAIPSPRPWAWGGAARSRPSSRLQAEPG
jgi:hypothetical protein